MQKNIVKDLIKPRKLEFSEHEAVYGKFIVEPLERGFGTTIGNSLRRILISTLQGSAIVGVRIQGVKHEFSTLHGCIEDVSEILLNLKQVVIDVKELDEVELILQANGPCEVTAGMIEAPPGVEVVNPNAFICSLNAEGKISMELIVCKSRGYIVSEENKEFLPSVDFIPLDASFSPVRKVNNFVTPARVGQRTDYDKLTIEIWTDGSITPENAIKTAAYVMRDQMTIIAGVQDEPVLVAEKLEEEKPKWNENLFRRIDEFDLSVRSSNCLENADIKFIGELVQRTEAEMLRTKNFGRKSLTEIKGLMGNLRLSLGMKLEEFPNREELERLSDAAGGE